MTSNNYHFCLFHCGISYFALWRQHFTGTCVMSSNGGHIAILKVYIYSVLQVLIDIGNRWFVTQRALSHEVQFGIFCRLNKMNIKIQNVFFSVTLIHILYGRKNWKKWSYIGITLLWYASLSSASSEDSWFLDSNFRVRPLWLYKAAPCRASGYFCISRSVLGVNNV